MDIELKDKFLKLWGKYFNGADLPIVFYYTNEPTGTQIRKPSQAHHCMLADLLKARSGESIFFGADSFGCFGGRRYLGFGQEVMPNFEYFLSCGIPGKLEGERYKKTPEMVKEIMKKAPKFDAPAGFIVFKRWDMLEEMDDPDVVIFFAHPDVLSGLFTLANFDAVELNAAFSPFSAGCGSIVQYPYLEKESDNPKAVIGMFDVSARPFVHENVLSFAAPMNKFSIMIENMQESFLITGSWEKIQKRIRKKP